MLSVVEQTRVRVSKSTAAQKKSDFGQFLTPVRTAQFMAGLFGEGIGGSCRLLDPGAGIGSLSCAFLDRCASGKLSFNDIAVSAFELDESLHGDLKHSLAQYASALPLAFEIHGGDFIEEAADRVQRGFTKEFTHAILNPPYKKIGSKTYHRHLLGKVGIETVNLYSAFVALSLAMLRPGGQLVAIVPRSFCNGPYYRPFRSFILRRAALKHIHLFGSRSTAFKDDEVLQENVIIMLERAAKQGTVTISCSTDDTFGDLATHAHSFQSIVSPTDPESFIHIPTVPQNKGGKTIEPFHNSLKEIGIEVSTGPVVDFRLKEHLRQLPEKNTVPLLYPGHFQQRKTVWPQPESKKPNALLRNAETERWLFPAGFYCVVRRLSSKEEKRRIVANVVDPGDFADSEALGFENHLNVFHENKRGLPAALARGLALFLNSSTVDEAFRRFSGHTQVNATDLRQLKYPSRAALIALGETLRTMPHDQQTIDDLIKEMERRDHQETTN